MNERKKTRKTLLKENEILNGRYTQAIYTIMEMRHALGDKDGKWKHPEVMKKIHELMGTEYEQATTAEV